MEVISVADARAGLSQLIARLRNGPSAEPVTIESHRHLKPVIERLAHAAHLTDVRVYGSVAPR